MRKPPKKRLRAFHDERDPTSQPKAAQDTLASVIVDKKIDLSAVGLTEEEIKKISQIYIVACGSAYHVGVAAQYVMEDLAKIPVRVELASEFRYRKPLIAKDSLAIVVSQSGETADSLAALREAKNLGAKNARRRQRRRLFHRARSG